MSVCTPAGRFPDAISVWQEALRRDPDAAACLAALKHMKALVATKEQGNTLYKAGAPGRSPAGGGGLRVARLTHVTLHHAGSFEPAAKVYAQGAALSRAFVPTGIAALYNNLAASHMARGDHAAGLAACSAAIAAQPFSAKAYERRAKCHSVSKVRHRRP